MEFSTNHDKIGHHKDFGFRIYEDLGENKGVNSADFTIWIDEYIDSREVLNEEIQVRALEFLKRAVSQLESSLKK